MITISQQGSIAALIQSMKDVYGRRVPYAASTALTRTAHIARSKAVPDEMRRVYDTVLTAQKAGIAAARAAMVGDTVFDMEMAQAAGLANVSLLAADDGSGKGTSKYGVDLSR